MTRDRRSLHPICGRLRGLARKPFRVERLAVSLGCAIALLRRMRRALAPTRREGSFAIPLGYSWVWLSLFGVSNDQRRRGLRSPISRGLECVDSGIETDWGRHHECTGVIGLTADDNLIAAICCSPRHNDHSLPSSESGSPDRGVSTARHSGRHQGGTRRGRADRRSGYVDRSAGRATCGSDGADCAHARRGIVDTRAYAERADLIDDDPAGKYPTTAVGGLENDDDRLTRNESRPPDVEGLVSGHSGLAGSQRSLGRNSVCAGVTWQTRGSRWAGVARVTRFTGKAS